MFAGLTELKIIVNNFLFVIVVLSRHDVMTTSACECKTVLFCFHDVTAVSRGWGKSKSINGILEGGLVAMENDILVNARKFSHKTNVILFHNVDFDYEYYDVMTPFLVDF